MKMQATTLPRLGRGRAPPPSLPAEDAGSGAALDGTGPAQPEVEEVEVVTQEQDGEETAEEHKEVSGKRVGIVDLGRIGSLVARRLSAFGCPVSYHSRSPKPSSLYKFYSTVRELAAESDVLVLCCALTDQTHHMINREVMEALGCKGILVNVGRGGLVDEPELVRCLRDGVIAGAGLDVYENEPDVPPELFGMDNVVLSNHRAVLTPESIQGVLDLVVGNLEAFFAGKPLLSPVAL